MSVCDCIVGLVANIKRAESYQKSFTDLENLYDALSQQTFKGELDVSRVPQGARQPEEGWSK